MSAQSRIELMIKSLRSEAQFEMEHAFMARQSADKAEAHANELLAEADEIAGIFLAGA